MARFKYRAVDAEGNAATGEMDEASARRVIAILEERGLTVNSVEEAVAKPRIPRLKTRLSIEDFEQFNSQMLTITRAGLPLAPAIAALEKDLRNPRLQKVLQNIRAELEAGVSLGDALDKYPEVFSPVYRTLVRAGEQAGNLAGVFDCLCGYSKDMVDLKNEAQVVLAYPAMLVVAAFGLVLFMLVKIVPVYTGIFADFGGGLPVPTQFVADLGIFTAMYLPLIGGASILLVALLFVLFRALLKHESRGYAFDWVRLHLSVFGRVYAAASLARFCRTLSMLVEARVPLTESLELAGAASGNAVLRHAASEAQAYVASGHTLAEGLTLSDYFPNSFCWLVGTSEQRGEIGLALNVLEKDNERFIGRMRKWILLMAGPLVVVLIGLLFGFLIVSLYLPIFSLGDVVSGH